MIQLQNIGFRYSAARPAVFCDFSLDLHSGNIVGLLGKNGTGKSTLLYLICGLLRPQKGECRYDGIDTSLRRPETLSEIFIVPEEFELPAITMNEYVAINAPFYPNFDRELLNDNLNAFELPTDINLGQLSMGQKKKAFMSFALASGTRLLLMDEPTNGLDIPSKSQFRRVVANSMNENRTIIISTHQVKDVEMLIDHVVMLEGNHLLVNESMAHISRKLNFEKRPYGADLSDALYVEPNIAGNSVITRGDGLNDSPIDLELLFNALINQPNLLHFTD